MSGPPIILHADMDAFYAAIEQRDQPSLRGRPVIVGGLGRRGVVSTASYEARAFGVHSALPTAIARRRCPDGVYLPPRMEVYLRESRAVRAVFDRFTDLVEPLSLDEAFLDVTGSARLFGDGRAIATQLRAQVREATGLTISVGVAACKFVAKVASDLEKPDGLVVVPAGTEAVFLAPLPVARLWGAGRVAQQTMARLGLATLGDVQRLPADALVRAFGEAAGRHYHALCRGDDPRSVVAGHAPQSISRETTFEQDLTGSHDCRRVLLALAEDVGRRLRKAGLVGATVRLKLRHPPFVTLTRQRHVEPATDDDMTIFETAASLLERARPGQRPVRLLGVGVADLRPREGGRQGHLFGQQTPGRDRLNRALDSIRQRFGPDAARHAEAAPGDEGQPRPEDTIGD